MKSLKIDVISDVVCPWCFIGAHRLEQALEGLTDIKPEIRYSPFLLDPTTPPEGEDLRARLRKKYGVDPETMFPRVEAAARESGLTIDFSKVRKSVSTIAAHTLLRHAFDRGTQLALAKALFVAYFVEGRDVGDTQVLQSIAVAHGFGDVEALDLLNDESELAATRADAQSFAEQGVTGVPFFVFDDRFAVSGAQPVAVFRRAIERALG